MTTFVSKPTDLYDPAWVAFNRQNPRLRKSVGAGTPEEEAAAAKAASEKVAADKAAAEKTAAEKEAAEKAAREKVSDKEAELLKEVMDKKAKLKAKDSELEALRKQFEGIDVEVVRQLLADRKAAEEADLEKKGEFDRLKSRMADEHKAEMAKKDAELEVLKASVSGTNKTIEELTVGQSFGNSPFIADELVLTPNKARVVYGAHFDIEEGKVVGYDKPRGASERTKLVDARGEPVPFELALKKIVDADPDKDKLIRAKGKPGAGSGTTNKDALPAKTELHGLSRIQAALNLKKVAK